MSKPINGMAVVCSVYDFDFIILTKDHKFGPGKIVDRKADIFLAKRADCVGKNRNDDYTRCNVRRSSDMTSTAKVLVNTM